MNSFLDRYAPRAPLMDDPKEMDRPLEAADSATLQIFELLEEIEGDLDQLRLIKSRVETMLPIEDANSIDLSQSLATQFRLCQALTTEAGANAHLKHRDRIAVMTAMNRVLEQLTNYQVKVYTIERSKHLETAIMQTLRGREDGNEILKSFQENFQRLAKSRPHEHEEPE